MQVDMAMELARQTLWQTLMVAGPLLLAALVVGGIVGLLQAVTQVQDTTISLVPKIVAVFVTLAICLPWLVSGMLEFSQKMFGTVPTYLIGG
ncbi:MAG: flagellar biosynthesis protein FliQ [Planctomycetota bacterium]